MRAQRYWLSAWMCVWVLALSTVGRAEVYFQVVAGGIETAPDGVVARESGATIRLAKGANLRLSPGAKLYRVHKQTRFWLSNGGRTLTHLVALASGRMDVESADPDLAVMVTAPLAVTSVVRGGRMQLVAQADQVSVVNQQGSVSWAMKTWKFVPLAAGKVRTLAKDSQGESDILPPPTVRLENNLFGGFARGAKLAGVSWEPLPGAVRYRVSVEQLEPERRLVNTVETAGTQLAPTLSLDAGRYAVSVQAVDRFAISGQFSSAQPFSVMGVRASEGGYVDVKGNIVAGYDRRVQLTYADGLLMKGPSEWQPLPAEIVLPSGEPMNLHLRQAGDTRLISTRVVPQQVKTSVTVGPKFARWPGESVRVEVAIEGLSPGNMPAWIEPRFRVLLGIDPLEVTWRREGNLYVAEVPPQSGEGPWIVRAEVEDQYGHLLGRDFVEIAPRPAPPARPATVAPPAAAAPPPLPTRASR
ncbi:MAG: hypothetical protein RL033_3852 [Pseudomonadota bacterium]|jgi:hypothetical protein